MGFLSILAALALEQLRPLGWRNPVFRLFGRFASALNRSLNAGEARHGALAWLIAVVPMVVIVLALYHAAAVLGVVFAWLINVLVLYFTTGFRQFSHGFTSINKALADGDVAEARRLLHEWTRQPTSELTVEEIAKLAIEQGVIDSYRHVFATLFWFSVLPGVCGPIGAIIYRMAALLDNRWGRRFRQFNEAFGWFAHRAMWVLDWLPLRLTALSFAIVGNFQDAVECWKNQADKWSEAALGVLLASAAGALGIRLGESVHRDHTVVYRPELGLGDAVDPLHLQSAVGLLWRTVILWLLVILLLSVAQFF